jgi:hypothetical protein
MRRIAISGLCILAGLATEGAASASAAAPEFGRCVKVATGTGVYATGNCTSAGGEQKYDWIPGPGPKPQFTLTVKAEEKRPFYLEGASSKSKIACLEGSATGEITGPDTIGSLKEFTWKGCEAGGIGPDNGLVFAEVGSGFLGVWKAGETALKDKVGLEFDPLLYHYVAGGIVSVHGEGEIIGAIGTNSMALGKTLSLVARNGKQFPDKFEGEPAVSLTQSISGGSPEPVVIGWKSTITFAEKIEINSVV